MSPQSPSKALRVAVSSLVCGLALVAAPQLFAEPACLQHALAGDDTAGDVELIDNAPPPIYVELGAGAAVGDRLRIEYRIDSRVSVIEELELAEAPAVAEDAAIQSTIPVVELLAGQPARLELVRRAQANGTVEVSIRHGEIDLGVFGLDGLEARGAELLQSAAASPFGLRSTVSVPGVRQVKGACEDRCDDEQDDCYFSRCGQFGSSSCYNACDIDWVDCLEDCGICQPSSSSTVTTTTVSTTPTSTVLCTRMFFHPQVRGQQRAFTRRLKDTTTTTTINSDCSETVTTSVSYRNTSCWQWINFNFCPFPVIENPAANC
ncbi:MAG: hypothetical protein AAGE94_02715 [Acidobacteriota bacterium]